MQRVVCQLEIAVDEVTASDDPLKDLLRRVSGSLNGAVDPVIPEPVEQIRSKIRLGQHLAARQRDPAAAHIVQRLVHRQLLRKLYGIHDLPGNAQKSLGTGVQTAMIRRAVRVGAGKPTPPAMDAAGFLHQFRGRRLSLRIVAPEAAHGTALEKDRGPYAAAVVHRKFLDIEEYAAHIKGRTRDVRSRDPGMACQAPRNTRSSPRSAR